MTSGQSFEQRLAQWLTDKIAGVSDLQVGEIRSASNGNSAETILTVVQFVRDGSAREQEIVVRMVKSDFPLFLDGNLLNSCRVLRALHGQPSVPSPMVIGAESDPDVLGKPFLVMEKVQGKVPPQQPPYLVSGWVKELSPEERARLWRNALQALANLNRLDWRDDFAFLGQPTLGKQGWPRYLRGIEEFYTWAADGRQLPIIDDAMTQIRAYDAADVEPSLLWGDAQMCNMMFHDDLSVAAILDWEVPTLGPAECDFAWWLFFEEYYSEATGYPPLGGTPGRAEAIDIYQEALGREVYDLEFGELVASLRMSLITLRASDRAVANGQMPPESKAGFHNPATAILARKLNLDFDFPITDFAAMMRN